MDSKKFVHLNSSYKDFLCKIEPVLANIELSQNTPMSKLQQTYDEISNIIGGSNIERNDLNNMLINCTNTNPTLQKLKDYVYLRNLKILEKTIKTDKYNDFVTKIKNLKGGASSKSIDGAFFKVIKPYFGYWDGLWRFIDFNRGKVRGVDVIDPNDIKQLTGYLE
jgi:hypothetical protein